MEEQEEGNEEAVNMLSSTTPSVAIVKRRKAMNVLGGLLFLLLLAGLVWLGKFGLLGLGSKQYPYDTPHIALSSFGCFGKSGLSIALGESRAYIFGGGISLVGMRRGRGRLMKSRECLS